MDELPLIRNNATTFGIRVFEQSSIFNSGHEAIEVRLEMMRVQV